MDRRIVEFISALRAAGVRVSLAESADAFTAIGFLGIQEREQFRVSLRATLVKDNDDQETFDRLFPLFFQAGTPPPMFNPSQEFTPDEANQIAEALRQFNRQIRKMLEKLLNGQPLSPAELQQMDRLLNQGSADNLRYQNWLARQMEQALRFREVRQAIEELLQLLNQVGMDRQRMDQLRQMMLANQQALQEQLRQFAGQRIAETMARQTRQERHDNLYNLPFNMLSEDDMRQMRREVRRLAAMLRTRVSLRMRRAKSGILDIKATLRANLKHQTVPFELRRRDHTLKPRIVILCDVSTSMRYCSELMLSLLGAIQDQISKTHAFAFIDHLEYISPLFVDSQPAEAITRILQKMPSGHYNTDFGFSLVNFNDEFLDTLDRHTTFLIVGDGRNNFNDPRLDLFRQLARRSRTTLWFNPEPIALWGTGDSDMPGYLPICQQVIQVSNLDQLASAIDHVLTT